MRETRRELQLTVVCVISTISTVQLSSEGFYRAAPLIGCKLHTSLTSADDPCHTTGRNESRLKWIITMSDVCKQ